VKAKSTPNWNRLARAAAEDANRNCFSSLRGILEYDDQPDVLALYNNTPYANDSERRPREEALLRQHLAARGIAELGYATFPTRGAEAGHTTAFIIGPLPSDVDIAWVCRAWEAVVAGRDFDPRGTLDLIAAAINDGTGDESVGSVDRTCGEP
jgi:hypothetical protein